MKRFSTSQRISVTLTSAIAIALSLWSSPTLAGDPFRSSNPRNIGNNTEAAFKAFFEEGNYPKAKNYLQQAESSESSDPMVYGMMASFAYNDENLGSLKAYIDKTLATAQKLMSNDPLRGHLYTGVGHFLETGYTFKSEGPLPAVNKLQQVFKDLEEAKKIDPNDPELNLIQGYMDILLSVHLPFSDPTEAIAQLENKARPSYLANRGIAVAYRDLKQYDQALSYAKQAFDAHPNNPEVNYLKAQLLFKQGEKQKNLSLLNEAKQLFDNALAKRQQLPKGLVAQMFFERCQTQERILGHGLPCTDKFNLVNSQPGSWGPAELPPLE